jgi:hypothetical protein
MKWFHPFECDNTVKRPFVSDYNNLEENGFNEWDFRKGKKIAKWKENIIFKAIKKKNDGNPDDALQNHLMLPIYSERLINALNKNKVKGIQYLPVHILRANDELVEGFGIANFLNIIEALDLKKADFSRYQHDFPNPIKRGQISMIRKYVLKQDKLNSVDITRLKEYPLAFFVSEKFKQIFEENKFTGYSFEEVELT